MSYTDPGYIEDVHDEKSGADYGYVPKDIFTVLPLMTIRPIGEGSTGEVYLMEHEDKPQVLMASKIFCFLDSAKEERRWRSFLQEVSALQQLQHENIVKCIGAITCPTYATILMEYFPEGDLCDHLDTLKDEDVHLYFSQISSAVRHMHAKQIVHRDIKLDNILIKKNTAYLTDFGLSQKLSQGTSTVTGRVGTLTFLAPGVAKASRTTEYDGFKADSFSVGVVLWCMMMKDEPEEDTELWHTLDLSKFDPFLSDCARRLLIKDPSDRWDISLLLDYLDSDCGGVQIMEL